MESTSSRPGSRGVASALREPGIVRRGSGDPTAEARRQDIELFAVLGHGATSDLESLLVQFLRDRIVRKWIALVLLVDERLDDVLRRAGGDVFAVLGLETAREEELELEHPARRLHVLA